MAIAILKEAAMPVVTIQVPAESLSDGQKAELVRRVTDVVVEVEGLPAIRPYVYVLVDEIPRPGYGLGGRVLDAETVKAMLAAASTADKAP
jgi:4-oxalocrotonate tautomerase